MSESTVAVTTTNDANWKYYLLVTISCFLQGSSFVSTKVLITDMSPLWVASLRFLLAALSLSPFVFIQLKQSNKKIRDLPWGKLSVIGILQTAGVMSFLNLGLETATPSTAAILMASNPLLVLVLAWLVLKEKSSLMTLVGLLAAFLGVIICIGLIGGENHSVGNGEILVMLASACWALSTIVSKKFNINLSPWIVTFWQMLIGSVILFIITLIKKENISFPGSTYHWEMLIWLAIPASTLAMGLWFAALKIGGSVQTSGFLFLCPLFSAIIAFFFLGQKPTFHEIVGGLLIGAGIFVISRWK